MVKSDFRYTKDMIFDEFKHAKEKDVKLSKKKTQDEKEHDIYKNRIAILKDYIKLEGEMPEVFEDVNINFRNLLKLYETTDPRDAFYRSIMGKSYAEVKASSQVKTMADYEKSANIKDLETSINEI